MKETGMFKILKKKKVEKTVTESNQQVKNTK